MPVASAVACMCAERSKNIGFGRVIAYIYVKYFIDIQNKPACAARGANRGINAAPSSNAAPARLRYGAAARALV